MRIAIVSFTGINAFLSNFAQCTVVLDGESYRSVEHAYQAAKTIVPAFRRGIQSTTSAGQAKRLGRCVPLREGWDEMKVDVMRDLLKQKFAKGTAYASLLLKTGDAELIEGNYWHDTFWGMCEGVGENHLGRLLMEIRSELKTHVKTTPSIR